MNTASPQNTCDCLMCENKTSPINIEQCLEFHHKLSLDELIHLIALSLANSNQLQDQTDATCRSSCANEYPRSVVTSLLELYASHHPHDWHKYESWNTTETYTRNLIAHHPNRFTLMLVCWTGGPSPIHNHAGSDCLMCVVRGVVREIKYYSPADEANVQELTVKESKNFHEGEVHLINDQIGLHKMETLNENQQAVTLHCYIPPYLDCFTFEKDDGEIKTNVVHTTYDTEFGKTV